MSFTSGGGGSNTTTTQPGIFSGGAAAGVAGGAGTLDTMSIPILGQAGADPHGLEGLLPNVGPGHAPQTVKNRINSVATLNGSKRNQLGTILANALGEKPKKNYTVSQVQSLLSTALNHTQQAGASSLSDYLDQQQQQGSSAAIGSNSAKITIPTPSETQTVYSTADVTATANAAAQKLVGRNATPDEIQAITATLNTNEAQNTQNRVSGSEASTASGDAAANSGSQVDSFLAAIRQHESGGNYKAYNSAGGASGAYQYIQSTWSSEAKAAGYGQYAGGPASAAPPQVQDAVARFNATNLFNSYGSWKNAAEAWYYPAWAGNPSKQNSVPMPGAGNKQTIGSYGDQIVSMMGSASQTPASTASGVTSPIGSGLTQGRTDQGVDFTGAGPLFAVDSGKILSVSNAGWPGGAFIALKLDHPIDPQHSVVYYAENIKANVKVGQTVKAGQQIGTATGASNSRGSGIEIGWGDPNAIGSALAHGSGGEGAVTAQGQNFLDYISGNAGGQALKAAVAAGGGPYLTAMDQQAKTMQNAVSMSGGANNATVVTQGANDPTSVAESYYMNQHSSDYQSNNLLGVFSVINDSLKTGGAQSTGVRGTPIDMRASA